MGMSWLSNTFDKITDKVAQDSALSKVIGRNRVKEIASTSIAGPMGYQYNYSRNKGMNGSEAQTNALTGGLSYQQARGEQNIRQTQDGLKEQDDLLAIQQAADSRKQRLQGQVTVRRRARAEQRSTKGGTLLTGAIGLPGSTTGSGPGATLLGG